MSTILRSALVAVALIASASASMAAPRYYDSGVQNYSGSNDTGRAYWDAQQRDGN
jgi:hypothetical protein